MSHDRSSREEAPAAAGAAQAVRKILEGYADSYATMYRIDGGGGKVSCNSVETDFRQNIIPQVLAALASKLAADVQAPNDWHDWVAMWMGDHDIVLSNEAYKRLKGAFRMLPAVATRAPEAAETEGTEALKLLDFRCTYCGSQPGVPCLGTMSGTHVQRRDALRAALKGVQPGERGEG